MKKILGFRNNGYPTKSNSSARSKDGALTGNRYHSFSIKPPTLLNRRYKPSPSIIEDGKAKKKISPSTYTERKAIPGLMSSRDIPHTLSLLYWSGVLSSFGNNTTSPETAILAGNLKEILPLSF